MSSNVKSTGALKKPANDDGSSTETCRKKTPVRRLFDSENWAQRLAGDGDSGKGANDRKEESDVPKKLKEMMRAFRRNCFNNWDIVKIRSEQPSCNEPTEKNVENLGRTLHGNKSIINKWKLNEGKGARKVSNIRRRMPSKEEAKFQKADPPSSSEDMFSTEGEHPADTVESIEETAKSVNFSETLSSSQKTDGNVLDPKLAKTIENRNRVIQYLIDIDEAEKKDAKANKLDKARKEPESSTSSTNIDPNATRDAVLKKYGLEVTSDDELVTYGRRAKNRAMRKSWFPADSGSQSSFSDDSEDSIDSFGVNEIIKHLKSAVGKKVHDFDLQEVLRHGSKWRNCLRYGCNCRPFTEEENKAREQENDEKFARFKKIYGNGTREDLRRGYDLIGAWVHNKTKKLDKFIESGKYPEEHLVHHWNGHFTDDSSGEEPDFEKYRKDWLDKLEAHQGGEDAPPILPEDRVPTFDENSGFLFPTPLTRALGSEEFRLIGHNPPTAEAAMDVLTENFQRSRDLKRAKDFMEHHPLPMPHMYPRSELFKFDQKTESSRNLTKAQRISISETNETVLNEL